MSDTEITNSDEGVHLYANGRIRFDVEGAPDNRVQLKRPTVGDYKKIVEYAKESDRDSQERCQGGMKAEDSMRIQYEWLWIRIINLLNENKFTFENVDDFPSIIISGKFWVLAMQHWQTRPLVPGVSPA